MMYRSSFARTLEGIQHATEVDTSVIQQADQKLSTVAFQVSNTFETSLEGNLKGLPTSNNQQHDIATHVARLAITIAFLRARGFGAEGQSVSDHELASIWQILRDALQSPLYDLAKVRRSHQGFLALPFCELTQANGLNDECWRLHVWLPSSPPMDPRLMIHSHKSFAQSWILAGEAENTTFNVTSAADDGSATNAIYELGTTFDRTLQPGSKEEVSGSVIRNTGEKVVVKETHRGRYHHGQSYVVPGNDFHTTLLGSKTLLATLFFFDAARGFFEEGGVPIGPLDDTEFTQYRNPEGTRTEVLVKVVEAARRWESLTEKAVEHAGDEAWKTAGEEFDRAADLWDKDTAPLCMMDGVPVARDLEDLGIYKTVAEALSTWTSLMAEGKVDRARRICEPFSQSPIVNRCLILTSRRKS